MTDELFVMESVDRATAWTTVFSRSTHTTTAEAASVLANMCGFPTWDFMVQAIESKRPSVVDEKLGKKALKQRHSSYRRVLVSIHALDPNYARYIIERLSPSSGKQFKIFSINTQEMHGPRDPGALDLAALREMSGLDDPAQAEKMLKDLLGDVMPEGFDFTNFEDRLRMSGEVDAACWFDILQALGWTIVDDESFNPQAEFGEPSMVIDDPALGHVPVFLSSVSRAPHDYDDKAAGWVMEACLENILEDWPDAETAYLLWKAPLRKVIKGRSYCHLGMLLYEDTWREVLVNKQCDTLAKVYQLNRALESIDSEPEELVDDHEAVFMGISRFIAGMDHPDAPKTGWKITEAGTQSGWNSVMIHNEL